MRLPRFRSLLTIIVGLALAFPAQAAAAPTDTGASPAGLTAAPIGGGSELTFNSSGRCTAAFAATQASEWYLIAGGACGSAGDTVSSGGVHVGTVVAAQFPQGAHTLVSVTNKSDWDLVAWAGPAPVTIRGSNQAPVGSQVCLIGSTTGVHCGTVTALNATINFPEGTITGVTQTSVCAEPGDRGSAFISGDQAQGVLIGGSGNCSSGGETFFQPIDYILSLYGLTLLTG